MKRNYLFFFTVAMVSLVWLSCSKKDDLAISTPILVPVPYSIAQISPQLVTITGGTFNMGSPLTEVARDSAEVQHQVTLSDFRMSKYEITNAQYAAFLNDTNKIGRKIIGSDGKYTAGANPNQILIYPSSDLQFSNGKWIPTTGKEKFPVVNVTWFGAAEFAAYAGGYLPTEAQWEYACRAGTSTRFNTGINLTSSQAKFGTLTSTWMVGTKAANAYGLCDMHGNVWEWCSDWFEVYPTTPQTNPTGAISGSSKVYRGGGINSTVNDCRSACRSFSTPSSCGTNIGFRVVVNIQ
ncbi:MAG: formylglycine-generating enzyme family protein [Paludibacter sp.]